MHTGADGRTEDESARPNERADLEGRRDFLRKAGRFAIYTPPAMMLLMRPSSARIAHSGGDQPVGKSNGRPIHSYHNGSGTTKSAGKPVWSHANSKQNGSGTTKPAGKPVWSHANSKQNGSSSARRRGRRRRTSFAAKVRKFVGSLFG